MLELQRRMSIDSCYLVQFDMDNDFLTAYGLNYMYTKLRHLLVWCSPVFYQK